jgi:hypothetical protein
LEVSGWEYSLLTNFKPGKILQNIAFQTICFAPDRTNLLYRKALVDAVSGT